MAISRTGERNKFSRSSHSLTHYCTLSPEFIDFHRGLIVFLSVIVTAVINCLGMLKALIPLLFSIILSSQAFAIMTELGLSYGFNKKTFDANNYYQMDSKSASVSLYFSEYIALELSYTDAFVEQQQKDVNTRVIQQTTRAGEANLMFLLASRQSTFQPYLKAGAAKITKTQVTKVDNFQTYKVDSPESTVPSYGGGLKIKLSEAFSLRFGVDYWRTPLEDGITSEDMSFKAGLSWML